MKQVAPRWESSLKWRSVLACRCLWKMKAHFLFGPFNFFFQQSQASKGRFFLMLNNWMFGSEPVKIYSPLLSLDPVARQDGIGSQACGLLFAEQSVPSAQEWPVSLTEEAVFASGLQYLLRCYLWWLKVQIGLVDEGSSPTHPAHLLCTLTRRLWVSFYLWMCWRSYTFFPHGL